MVDLWDLGISLVVLTILVAVAVYLVGKIRSMAVQKEHRDGELLSNFRDLHSQGVLDDAEFRTIKTTLAGRRRCEVKDNDETG